MTRKVLTAAIPIVLSCFAGAQTAPLQTTVCDIAAHPGKYSERMVTVRVRIIAGFEVFAIEDPSGGCERMWLKYEGGGPIAMTYWESRVPHRRQAPLVLERDAGFQNLTEMLDAKMYPRKRGTSCVGCHRYEATATLTGRVDVAPAGTGYGHLNAYSLQFELQSAADVAGTDLAAHYDSALFSPAPVRFPTGYFKGMVRSPGGDPVKSILVTATRTDDVPLYMQQVRKWTDDQGKFELAVPPGTYVLGINTDGPVIVKYPFPPTYFPAATERTSATVLKVEDGQTIETDVNIPRMAVRRDVTVHVEWPDGRPAEGVQVWLLEPQYTFEVAGMGDVTHTDKRGMMTLPAFEGFDYTAHAETNVLHRNSHEYFCAQPVRIDATGAARDVVLKLNFKGEEGC